MTDASSKVNLQCYERVIAEIESLERLPSGALAEYAHGLGTMRNYQECVRSLCVAANIDLSKDVHLRLSLNSKFSTNGDVLAALKSIRNEWLRFDPTLEAVEMSRRASALQSAVAAMLPSVTAELTKRYFLWPKRTFWGSAIGAGAAVLLAAGLISWRASVAAIETRIGAGVVERITQADKRVSAEEPLGRLTKLESRTVELSAELHWNRVLWGRLALLAASFAKNSPDVNLELSRKFALDTTHLSAQVSSAELRELEKTFAKLPNLKDSR